MSIGHETLQPLSIGTESSSLAGMLSKHLNTLSQSLEPLPIILVGAIIRGPVITLYLPIFNPEQIAR